MPGSGHRGRHVTSGDTVASYQEFAQIYPRPGWVEHDASDGTDGEQRWRLTDNGRHIRVS